MKYVCIARCPELDIDNEKHCITENYKEYECPCGNATLFVESIYENEEVSK